MRRATAHEVGRSTRWLSRGRNDERLRLSERKSERKQKKKMKRRKEKRRKKVKREERETGGKRKKSEKKENGKKKSKKGEQKWPGARPRAGEVNCKFPGSQQFDGRDECVRLGIFPRLDAR